MNAAQSRTWSVDTLKRQERMTDYQRRSSRQAGPGRAPLAQAKAAGKRSGDGMDCNGEVAER